MPSCRPAAIPSFLHAGGSALRDSHGDSATQGITRCSLRDARLTVFRCCGSRLSTDGKNSLKQPFIPSAYCIPMKSRTALPLHRIGKTVPAGRREVDGGCMDGAVIALRGTERTKNIYITITLFPKLVGSETWHPGFPHRLPAFTPARAIAFPPSRRLGPSPSRLHAGSSMPPQWIGSCRPIGKQLLNANTVN